MQLEAPEAVNMHRISKTYPTGTCAASLHLLHPIYFFALIFKRYLPFAILFGTRLSFQKRNLFVLTSLYETTQAELNRPDDCQVTLPGFSFEFLTPA